MDRQNNSWFLVFQFEKSMYTLSQNMISVSAQPSVLSWKGGYITMYLKLMRIKKVPWRMNTLTITNIKFICKCYLSSFCTTGHFKLVSKKQKLGTAFFTHHLVNTFIMLDWGASKQLHSIHEYWIMPCASFHAVFMLLCHLWCDSGMMCLFNRQ